MSKKKGRRRGPKPKPSDVFWKKYWPYVTANNRQRFHEAYERSMNLTGQRPISWTPEYPIFNMSRELVIAFMEDDTI